MTVVAIRTSLIDQLAFYVLDNDVGYVRNET